ncbi:DUF488 domain-containing protein [Streptomyces sp. NPDC059740]|uniref:DUF488 domain-containing protein n=1 Tax=Streptomyces sp. NPDC059740 TaxID=3346926 RepID=UPI003666FED5
MTAARERRTGGGAGREVRVRRVYDPPEPEDGTRVLVDRLWPRGLAKDAAHLDMWCKEVAPSAELRRWFGHRSERFAEFTEAYRAELAEPAREEALRDLLDRAGKGPLTLLTASKNPDESHVAVLLEAVRRAH